MKKAIKYILLMFLGWKIGSYLVKVKRFIVTAHISDKLADDIVDKAVKILMGPDYKPPYRIPRYRQPPERYRVRYNPSRSN